MRVGSGGYSRVQYDTTALRAKAQQLAKRIPEVMRELNADAVAVTGKSGIALAFATLMLIDFPLIVVRKRGENSHGNPVEGPSTVNVRRYIILDDFVASGNTVRNIEAAISERAEFEKEPEDRVVQCVGVLEYLRDYLAGEVVRDVWVDGDARTPSYYIPVTQL